MGVSLGLGLVKRYRNFRRQIGEVRNAPVEYRGVIGRIAKASPIWGSHQTIVFPNGYVLKGGRDQSRFEQFGLPNDLSGKSVLDIGCNIGGVAMECKRRNADRVLGLDYSPALVQCARDLATIFKYDIEYRQFDVSRDALDEKFDVIFFLNVFHHLDQKARIRALRMLSGISKGVVFFEAPVADDIVAKDSAILSLDDYLSFFKGFTSFSKVSVIADTDFGRPLIRCEA